MRLIRVVQGALVAVSVITLAMVAANPGEGWAAGIVVGTLVVCPGLAIVLLLGLRDPMAVVSLAVATGLALNVGVAQLLVYGGLWSGRLGAAVLMGISLACALGPMVAQAVPGESRIGEGQGTPDGGGDAPLRRASPDVAPSSSGRAGAVAGEADWR